MNKSTITIDVLNMAALENSKTCIFVKVADHSIIRENMQHHKNGML